MFRGGGSGRSGRGGQGSRQSNPPPQAASPRPAAAQPAPAPPAPAAPEPPTAEVQRDIQNMEQDLGPVREIITQPFSEDMSGIVDMMVGEATAPVQGHMARLDEFHQNGWNELVDMVENAQFTMITLHSEIDAWKQGLPPDDPEIPPDNQEEVAIPEPPAEPAPPPEERAPTPEPEPVLAPVPVAAPEVIEKADEEPAYRPRADGTAGFLDISLPGTPREMKEIEEREQRELVS